MKKYLLILVAMMMTAIGMSSCGGDTPPPPPPPPPPTDKIELKAVKHAIYFGQKMGDAAGFYSFEAEGKTKDGVMHRVRFNCFGAVAPNPNSATLASITYEFSSMDDVKSGKFFGAETTTSEYGSIYWADNVPAVITGGTFTVTVINGSYTIKFDFKVGDKDVSGTFKNTLRFDNKFTYAPREEGVREAKKVAGRYYGNSNDAKLETGLFVLDMLLDGELSKKAVALEIMGYMPLHTTQSADNQRIPAGTYTIKPTSDGSLNSLVPGNLVDLGDDSDADGTVEFSSGDNGKFEFGWIIKEGTMVVEYTSGNNCKITATMKGNRVSKTEILNTNLETVDYIYEGEMPMLQNYADPMSNIKESIDLTAAMDRGILNVGTSDVQGTKFNLREIFLFGEGLDYTLNNGNLSMSGKGHYLVFSLWDNTIAANGAPDFITGEFKMAKNFGVVNLGSQIIMPGVPGVPESITPGYGTWYAYYNVDDEVMEAVGGAVPAVGQVKTSEDANNYIFDIEFWDKNNKKVSGIVSIPKGSMYVVNN